MNIDGHNAMSLQNILEMVHSYRPKHIVCILAVWGQIEYGVQKAQGKYFKAVYYALDQSCRERT